VGTTASSAASGGGERHRQRLSDLLYDSVALELGGSE